MKSATFSLILMKNVMVFHFFAFFLKNDKDFHQKCYFAIDFDEKRTGFFIVLRFSKKNDKDFHEKCYCLIDIDEKRNGFVMVLQVSLKSHKDFH